MFRYIRNRPFNRSMGFYEIDLKELKEKQKNGAEIIDVRSSQEYYEGHLDGAINIPYYEIQKIAISILKEKNQEIVLYCQTGYRSKQAYKKLIKLKYKRVYCLYGGIDNWL